MFSTHRRLPLPFPALWLLVALFTTLVAAPADAAVPSLIGAAPVKRQVRPAFDVKSEALPIALNRAALAATRANDEMELALPDGTRELVVFDRVEDHGGGIKTSVGYLKALGRDYRVLITAGPSGSFGSIRTANTAYRIIPGDGHDWLVDKMEESVHLPLPTREKDYVRVLDDEDYPGKPDLTPRPQLSSKGAVDRGVTADSPADPARIDLMVVYTTGLANKLGPNLMTRLFNLVAAANMAYVDSAVQMTLRLVNATMINYTDGTSNGTALDAISPGRPGFNAAFSGVETIRNAHGADLVALLRDGGDNFGSGIAWLTLSKGPAYGQSLPNPQRMYSVTTGCVVGCDSVFIHELGHNMGNAHDRATDAAQGNGVVDGGAFPYSFGHYFCASGVLTCNPDLPAASGGCGPSNLPQCSTSSTNNMGTIMSYFDPVTLKFSNPNITCRQTPTSNPQPCGVPEFAGNSANNALSMNNMRNVIQDAKTQTIAGGLPGLIQFSAMTYSVSETAGTANLTVNRLNGSTGAISVNYTIDAFGTAKAGFDYTGTGGTLNWADGDSAAKIISIPVINDGVTEGTESFTVMLSSPSGATGVFLGNLTTATVQLTEPGTSWPPGGVSPVGAGGYVAPGMAAGAWDLAPMGSGCNAPDVSCMRSPRVIATTFDVYVNADLEYSALFPAGTVSFDYRVSSYPGYGELVFMVDNVAVFTSNGGETGWLSFSTQLTAGNHTLRWRYRNALPFGCNVAVPAAPGGSNCADRAWIDNVVLPITLTSSTTNISPSANPSFAGQNVTFTATVSGFSGTPAGVITFRDGGNVIAGCNLVVMSGGSAQCTTSALPQGVRVITAAYSGNTTYNVSVSPNLNQTVNPGSFLLSVIRDGSGSGNVTSNPAGINTAIGNNSATFNAGNLVALTAVPSGGSTFNGWSGGGCSGTGGCNVTLNAATSVTATFNIILTAPGSPVIGAGNAGNGQAIINFSPPGSDGGSAITGYTATCNVGGFTGTGTMSPIVVNGLTNGVNYSCSVTATNAIGTSVPSGTVNVMPSAGAPVALLSVASRKVHGAAGPFNLPLNISPQAVDPIKVEPRTSSSGHLIVFTFSGPVTSAGTPALLAADGVTPFGQATAAFSGNEVRVTLTGVTDNRRARVTLTGVNGTTNAATNVGFLLGDIGNTRMVTAGDIAALRARVGADVTLGTNYLFDLNLSGDISAADVSAAKSRAGLVLLP